jgi:hypothetical protein
MRMIPLRFFSVKTPGIIIQVKDEDDVEEFLLENGISYFSIGHPVNDRTLFVTNNDDLLYISI